MQSQRIVTIWRSGNRFMEIALHQQFEKQRLQGVIDQSKDLTELKDLAKQLVDLYFKQKLQPPGPSIRQRPRRPNRI